MKIWFKYQNFLKIPLSETKLDELVTYGGESVRDIAAIKEISESSRLSNEMILPMTISVVDDKTSEYLQKLYWWRTGDLWLIMNRYHWLSASSCRKYLRVSNVDLYRFIPCDQPIPSRHLPPRI